MVANTHSLLGKVLLLLPSALLALTVVHALADKFEAQSTVMGAPVAFTPDENWDGIDGSWNSFTLRIGTPAQYVRVFPSFVSYQTCAVLTEGCTAASDQTACAMARGSLYNESASTTFDRIGIYDLWIERHLGYHGNAVYGYDTVGLGGNGENGPTLQNTTVGGFALDVFYLGILGLNPKPTNFTSFNHPSSSYMTKLKEQKYIPSISASYTAGAPYRFTGVLASLTLGGYDTSKFVENDVEFTFAADNERDMLVGIQSISTPSDNSSSPVPTELLPGPIYAMIDSTVPQMWLPVEACAVFESVFGLRYDNETDLYLVNDSLHQTLLHRNANITFTLAQGLTGGDTVNIVLPYAAFDLTASPPYQGLTNSTRYFPLRRAQNETQYTLGRTFFQEAYVTVDWEQSKFNISQVAWNQNAETNLVAIPPGSEAATYPGVAPSSTSPHSTNGGLSGGAIAGIVIGVIAAIAIIAGLIYFFLRRRRQVAKHKAIEQEKLGSTDSNASDHIPNATAGETTQPGRRANVFPKAELEGSSPISSENKRLLSARSSEPATPGTLGAPSSVGYSLNGRPNSSGYSPTTPRDGEGTHISTQSRSNSTGMGTHNSPIMSPLSASGVSEADSKERQIFEMPGDMPAIKEKDGKNLSEKEALQYRERVYNGVDSAPQSAIDVNDTGIREARRVDQNDVVRADLNAHNEQRDFVHHRPFSFEEHRTDFSRGENTEELYWAS